MNTGANLHDEEIQWDRDLVHIESGFSTYQELALQTAVYPHETALAYTALGLVNEAGEYAGKLKKVIRGDKQLDVEAAAAELGEVLWYVAAAANALGVDLGVIAFNNLEKLRDRAKRGVIKGDGDTR